MFSSFEIDIPMNNSTLWEALDQGKRRESPMAGPSNLQKKRVFPKLKEPRRFPMTIQQTVEIPASHRLTIDVPKGKAAKR
jgi:hypothetical protein